MNRKKDIIQKINDLSGSRSPYEVYCDWVKLMVLSLQNTCCPFPLYQNKTWERREEEYIKTIQPYGEDGKVFVDMFGMLTETLDDSISDVLGEIYMESGCGNKNTGQFFTPFHVSVLCASMNVQNMLLEIEQTGKIILNEPSCGGGGMIIAAAKVLKDRGVNYQHCMKVVAQDLDWKAVYMCYVQLSLLGVDAVVVQGNTLMDLDWKARPPECIFRTPNRMGMLI